MRLCIELISFFLFYIVMNRQSVTREIVQWSDRATRDEMQELLTDMVKLNKQALKHSKQCLDGTRINLDKLNIEVLEWVLERTKQTKIIPEKYRL